MHQSQIWARMRPLVTFYLLCRLFILLLFIHILIVYELMYISIMHNTLHNSYTTLASSGLDLCHHWPLVSYVIKCAKSLPGHRTYMHNLEVCKLANLKHI